MKRAAKNGAEKKKVGRKPYIPTDDVIETVKRMARVGIHHDEIARFLGIATSTLEKRFVKELRESALDANARVGDSLYTQAINGNVAAAIFWAKTRMRWRETERVEVTGADGGAIAIEDARATVAARIAALAGNAGSEDPEENT